MRSFRLGKPTREAYGETLRELGAKDSRIVVLDADLSKSTYTRYFKEKFPDRFFNFGIQEANMVSAAAGLAATGMIPFVSSFACFLVDKAFEQLKMSIAGSGGFNVKFVASHGGISVGQDGFSQQSVEDVALMCTLPGFVVMVPCDEVETRLAVKAAYEHVGPVYIRVGRPKAPIIYENPPDFKIGRAITLRKGEDVTIIANGLLVAEALKASDLLEDKGISARVIDMHTVKPLDREAIEGAARETKGIVTAEEHIVDGGLGSRVARLVSELNPVPMEFVGIEDTYAESGTPEELFEKYGLTAENIMEKALKVLKRTK
jgi:transketolase